MNLLYFFIETLKILDPWSSKLFLNCDTLALINNSQTAVTYQFNIQYRRGNTM